MQTKICSCCQQPKPIEEYIRSQKHSQTGKVYQFERSKCMTCIHKRQKERLQERFGPNGVKLYNDQERLRRRCRTVYKTTLPEAQKLLTKQNNCCAICEKPIQFLTAEYRQRACIDHNHTTGIIRGILCHHCNSGLGYFEDNITRLQNCQTYLTLHQGHEPAP